MNDAAVKDRFLQLASTARALLSDFREVEQNFRELDRGVRERIALCQGSKGELLEDILGERDAIGDSDPNLNVSLLVHVDLRQNARVPAFSEHTYAALVAHRPLFEGDAPQPAQRRPSGPVAITKGSAGPRARRRRP
jgi:hypothetical protein